MINLIFAKDYDTGEGITQNSMNDEAREKIREKYLNIFEIIEKKFSQQNKVLGNIEKFA